VSALLLVQCLESAPEAEHCPEGPVADSNEGGPTGDDISVDVPVGSSTTLAEGLRVQVAGDVGARITETSELAPAGVRHFTPVLTFEQLASSSSTAEVSVNIADVAAKSCQPVRVFARTDADWSEVPDGVVSVGADPVQVVVARACDAGAVFCEGECRWLGADETCLDCTEGCEADSLCVAGSCDGTRVAGDPIQVTAAGDGFAIGVQAGAASSFVVQRIAADGTSDELATFTATEPSIAVDGDAIFYADGISDTTAAVTIRRVAEPGATPEDVVTGRWSVEGLASDGTQIYWAETLTTGGATHVTIARAPLAGGAVEVLSDVAEDTSARLLGLDEGVVLWKTAASYWSLPLDGGTPTELAAVTGSAEAVSGGWLYFASDEAFTIERVPVGGGEAELIHEAYAAVTALVADGEVPFWVESEEESWPSVPLGLRHRLYVLGEEGATEVRRLAGGGWSGVALDASSVFLGSEQGLEIVPR
jgi:hypothetical protein